MLNLACRPAAARPVIPKRGEKEFEPRARGGTNLQAHVLERSRAAMFDTLLTTRTISRQLTTLSSWYAPCTDWPYQQGNKLWYLAPKT